MTERHLRSQIGNVIIGQLLPQGVVRGGTAMYLRRGVGNSRFSADFDVARKASVTISQFEEHLTQRISLGWHGFAGRLVRTRAAKKPPGVPDEYVMVPYDLKLSYQGSPWFTVTFELGHEELGGDYVAERVLDPSIRKVFQLLGLPEPQPVPVLPIAHQIAQKLHACTTPNNDRAHDLVDLQLLERGDPIDLNETANACRRLFASRRMQDWPPVVAAGPRWSTLYAAARMDLPVRDLPAAVDWVNDLIRRVDGTSPLAQ